jgi:hypothetical protein
MAARRNKTSVGRPVGCLRRGNAPVFAWLWHDYCFRGKIVSTGVYHRVLTVVNYTGWEVDRETQILSAAERPKTIAPLAVRMESVLS